MGARSGGGNFDRSWPKVATLFVQMCLLLISSMSEIAKTHFTMSNLRN